MLFMAHGCKSSSRGQFAFIETCRNYSTVVAYTKVANLESVEPETSNGTFADLYLDILKEILFEAEQSVHQKPLNQHWFHIDSDTSNYDIESMPTKHRVAILF